MFNIFFRNDIHKMKLLKICFWVRQNLLKIYSLFSKQIILFSNIICVLYILKRKNSYKYIAQVWGMWGIW